MDKRIKQLRKDKNITQREAAIYTHIPLRTFKLYENDDSKIGSIKYNYIVDMLDGYGYIDETHGILDIESITSKCSGILKNYDVEYAILFGSYARGEAKEESDIDLLVATNIGGLRFFQLAEELRQKLCKKVDLLNLAQLKDNEELIHDVLRDGVRVYVKE